MIFEVAITFSEVTPESAEHGDFSKTGFVMERTPMTLREVIDLIKYERFQRESRGTSWMTTGFSTSCYRTGTEREECLHLTLMEAK